MNTHPYLPYDREREILIPPYIANSNYYVVTDFLGYLDKKFYYNVPCTFQLDAFVKHLSSLETLFHPITLTLSELEEESYLILDWPDPIILHDLPKSIRIYECAANDTPEYPLQSEYIFSFCEDDETLHIKSTKLEITIGNLPQYLYIEN